MAEIERDLIAWLQTHQRPLPAVRLGIGDDMAIVETSSSAVLLSSDMLLDGVHFDTRVQSLGDIGRKAIASCLSDCAAMAVRPVAATVSLALPDSMTLEPVKALFGGMFAVANEFELAIAGGDVTRWCHPLAIDVAMVATPYEDIRPISRSGALPGDRLFVTGQLGGSLLGHHLSFVPRVHEAHRLAESLGDRLHAMLDISDGLSLDLWRMCQASGVGALLDEKWLEAVASDDARRVGDSQSAIDHVLGDGEDFELLLAVAGDPGDASVPLFPVGEVTREGLALRHADGHVTPLEPKGYVH